MAKLRIDNNEYDTDAISDDAKAQLAAVQFCETELRDLQAKASAIQLARTSYLAALKNALDNPLVSSGSSGPTTHRGEPVNAVEQASPSEAAGKKKKGLLGGLFSK